MVDIVPIGNGKDDSAQINAALKAGITINLNGDFIILKTIYIPTGVIWNLNGTITIGKSPTFDKIPGATNPTKSLTAITEKYGTTNITMNGGKYIGNGKTTTIRFLNFINLKNSNFTNMIIQNGDHCFILDGGCNNNVCTNVNANNSLNGLADRGDHNTWNNCIAESCDSDNFIIKCRDSIFNKCKGKNSVSSVGFGAYARVDNDAKDIGADISRNKFIECEASGNGHSGFSLNCPSNGPNAKIEDNFIQMTIYDNCKKQDSSTQSGLYLRNKLANSSLKNNKFDILTYNNGPKGGFTCEAMNGPITNNSGDIVTYGNSPDDLNFNQKLATNNTFTVHQPSDKSPAKIVEGSNAVKVVNFTCPVSDTDPFCTKTYCAGNPTPPPTSTKFKISQSKTKITVSVSKTGKYTADQACKIVCDFVTSLSTVKIEEFEGIEEEIDVENIEKIE